MVSHVLGSGSRFVLGNPSSTRQFASRFPQSDWVINP
jgi:hypothetical protein